jgi:hypothetical protein
MRLFEKYTVPSVQAQTFKDFRWVILVDPYFKGITKGYIEKLAQYGDVVPVDFYFVEKQPDVGMALNGEYKDEWVCSTRLDSDDIIRNDFMERVHEQATEEESFITFRNGYMMNGHQVAPRLDTRNPFCSYVEYADPFRSIYATGHRAVHRQKAPLKVIEEPRGWVQVDHGDNVKNLVRVKMKDFEEKAIPADSIRGEFTWSTNDFVR